MKKSPFFRQIPTRMPGRPAIEMEPNDPVKPTDVETVADVKKIDSPFEGIEHDKKPEDQNLELTKTTEIGTEPAFDKEQEDYVAQGQEDGLALEHMHERMRRHLNRSFALEDIAEIAQKTLDGEAPVEGVEPSEPKEPGISPAAALMVTRALDMDDLGDEVQPSVAIEAFDFDPVAATESFVDRIANKATQEGGKAGAYAGRIIGKLQNTAQRVQGQLGKVEGSLETLRNDFRDVNTSGVQLDKAAITRVYKNMAVKNETPIQALQETYKLFDQAVQLASRGYTDVNRRLQEALDSRDPDKVFAAVNEAIALSRKMSTLTNNQHSSFQMDASSLQNVTADTDPKSIKVDYDWSNGDENGTVPTSLAGCTAKDLDAALQFVTRADRVMNGPQLTTGQTIKGVLIGAAVGGAISAATGGMLPNTAAIGAASASKAYTDYARKKGKEGLSNEDKVAKYKELSRTKSNAVSEEMTMAIRLARKVLVETYDTAMQAVYGLGDDVVKCGHAVRQWGTETISAGRKARGATAPASGETAAA